MANVPGIKAIHAVVTLNCRDGKGLGALDEALERLREEYLGLVDISANADADFHFVLTVDRPRG